MQPKREQSLFWNNLWIECGRPKTGSVADCMRRTRAAYHGALRKVRKEHDGIICDRFANGLLNNDSRNFWKEVKRIRTKKHSISSVIDGEHDGISTAKLFTSKY